MGLAARLSPWLARLALAAAGIVLLLVATKFIVDPVGSGAVSQIRLGSALARTNMRASFGAFPLGSALFALGSLRFRQWHLAGLSAVAAVLGSALLVRICGVALDGTLEESRTVLIAEAAILTLALGGIASEIAARSGQQTEGRGRS